MAEILYRVSVVRLRDLQIFIYAAHTCDHIVTNVTEFPFMGGSLCDKRDRLAQHADLLLQLQFWRYREIIAMGGILGNGVSTSEISKRADECSVRKLWVVH